MPFNFPDSPTLNQVYAYNGQAWKWNGDAWDKNKGDAVSIKDFGAVCDFTTDDAAAIQDALDSGATYVFAPANTAIGSMITIPAGVTFDLRWNSVKKAANTDMFDMSAARCRLINGRLEGQGSVGRTSRGIIIGGGSDQLMLNLDVADMSGYCLEFTASDIAGRFVWDGGFVQRTTATDKAIKLPGADSLTFGDRTFKRLKAGGGTLFFIDGASMTLIDSCNFVVDSGMFGAAAKQTLITNCRIAGSSWTLDGQGHLITNCSISPNITVVNGATLIHMNNNNCAGSLTLNSGATSCRFESTTFQGGVADNTANLTNWVDYEQDFTPTWGADSVNPSLGNGTLTGRFRRKGKHVRVDINLTMGSTTTYGTGAWFFELPSGLNQNVKARALGVARAVDTGTASHTGVSTISAGAAPKIYTISSGAAAFWQSNTPHTWASTDVLILSAEWEIG
jgi:hypothetical protein